MSTILAILFIFVSLFMMLVILIQKPKGGGLSGAFGGAGSGSDRAFVGGNVGDVLTWITVVCFTLFLILAMGLTWVIRAEEHVPARTPATTTSNTAATTDTTADPTPDPITTTTPDARTDSPAAGPTAGAFRRPRRSGRPHPRPRPHRPLGRRGHRRVAP